MFADIERVIKEESLSILRGFFIFYLAESLFLKGFSFAEKVLSTLLMLRIIRFVRNDAAIFFSSVRFSLCLSRLVGRLRLVRRL